ncbi:hypothetical protein N7488_009237 [Penicillium malachiteum]|nr:hypothetical protein N7488_009237 [Penicillium malachiteum]
MWVGKLFGTLSLALIFQGNGECFSEEQTRLIEKFDLKIKQCLVLGRYQDCPPDTIEAICGSLNTQFHQSGDGEMSSLVILGVLVRMAQRMGYHRDASHFPHISPFHGEMRRRVWAIIKDLDVMLSLSAGLPRILREFQSDTAPPRNILDADFDEDLSELPPSRPESFPTPCQWLVAKNKLTSMLGIISDVVTSIRRPSYSEVMRLDKVLHETYASIPDHFHERPLHKSLMDTSETILHRVQLVSLYSKARCLLHYRYLASARSDHRYAYSRDSCLEASLKILENQDMMFQESQRCGRLYHERWKVKSPIMRGVIMLATTLICLEINHELSNDLKSNKKHIPLPGDVIHRLIQALQQSRTIWEEQKDLHHDIPRTIQAIDVIFSKLEKQQKDTPSQAVDETSPSNKGPGYDSTRGMISTFQGIWDRLANMIFIDFFSGSNPSAWPELEGAMFIDQAINFQQLQANNMDSPMSPFTIGPELLDLVSRSFFSMPDLTLILLQTNSVDLMLGMSMNYPRTTRF